jgi:hypothetical protein
LERGLARCSIAKQQAYTCATQWGKETEHYVYQYEGLVIDFISTDGVKKNDKVKQ